MTERDVWFVSRQSYYPDGDLVIEIAYGGRDYSNPDKLAEVSGSAIARLTGEYSDPREALTAAREIKRLWQEQEPEAEIGIATGYTLGATMPFEASADEELEQWAMRKWAMLPKCDHCGDRLPSDGTWYSLPDCDPDLRFCSEYCADEGNSAYLSDSDPEGDDPDVPDVPAEYGTIYLRSQHARRAHNLCPYEHPIEEFCSVCRAIVAALEEVFDLGVQEGWHQCRDYCSVQEPRDFEKGAYRE